MRVLLLKDIENVGMAGEIVKVTEGFGANYLIPRKLGVEVTEKNEKQYQTRIKTIEHRKEVISSKTSMLAEKIKSLKLKMKKKTNDQGKLFGAITSNDVMELLLEHGISVRKSQINFGKTIKTPGTFEVTVKLSTKLQPMFSLTITAA